MLRSESLRTLGDERVLPALAGMLESGHRNVRQEAAWALSEIGGPRAVEASIPYLHSYSEPICKEAAGILVRIGSHEAFDALLKEIPFMDGLRFGVFAFSLVRRGAYRLQSHDLRSCCRNGLKKK